ncbi:MAG: SRPBCC family protein [Myxococcota bacterium]|nr:SRPBCC family protein [Myxococcota bacterium]
MDRISRTIAALTGLCLGAATGISGTAHAGATWEASATQEFQAPAQLVFANFAELGRWQAWSAWGLHEYPRTTWSVEGDPGTVGQQVSWSGPKVGAGRLVITQLVGHEQLSYDLFFGHSDTPTRGSITVSTTDTGCQVTWKDSGTLGFPASLLGGMIARSVSRDFEEGLSRLDWFVKEEISARAKVEAVTAMTAQQPPAETAQQPAHQEGEEVATETAQGEMNDGDDAGVEDAGEAEKSGSSGETPAPDDEIDELLR